ncbi:MAG: AAA family ATPase, partial [Bacteroidota bacterium]|nr:AAA family ATPase [Bacteroidota bacterium]
MKFPSSINRSQYLENVVNYIDKSIIKVFTGQRRVGKSYMLYQIIALIQSKNPKANIIYINKEDLAFSDIKNAEDLNNYIKAHKEDNTKNYIFIDEIQDIQNFEITLRSLLLDQDYDIYCTGSNANLLSGDIAGFLSGRYIEIAVYSLSYTE